jgi:ABC-type branched-subunit amino acid transport system substrate-binding protein
VSVLARRARRVAIAGSAATLALLAATAVPAAASTSADGALASAATGSRGGTGAASGKYTCAAGQNGGSTDIGVSGTGIQLASTAAESGIAASFLGDVRYGMDAVVSATNNAGGVCGRKLSLTLVDDAWSPAGGEQDIKNFIAQGDFALPVMPSSNGLDAASRDGVIDSAGIPVVGTDGMLSSQYSDRWIWPVGSSTISTAHIAAQTAYNAGARTFGIVYEQSYPFGTEGDGAFAGEIRRLSGATLRADVGVNAGQGDYAGAGATVNSQCAAGCDMIFVLLDPSTAVAWFSTSGMNPGTKLTEGPQPLFVDSFGQNCGPACNNMLVWTSYYPPRPPFDSQSAVSAYVNAVRSVSASADVDNQFLEGGYDGMGLVVQALKTVGPDLTRTALQQTLDGLTFDSGLSQPMTWRPGNHVANTSMLGFSIQYSGAFNGFQYLNTGWVQDPGVNCDQPPPTAQAPETPLGVLLPLVGVLPAVAFRYRRQRARGLDTMPGLDIPGSQLRIERPASQGKEGSASPSCWPRQ